MNLLNSPILEIALTLAFIYSTLGLMVSTINEVVMSLLKKRQQFLKEAINGLLFDEEWKRISASLINSPFIKSLKRKQNGFPAYIPARNFAQALLDVVRHENETLTVQKIRETLTRDDSPIKGDTKQLLAGILDEAENDLSKFYDGLEKFYDDSMDRANSWYKEYVRIWIFCISLVICAALNVDTLLITKRLWQDPAAIKQSAQLIEETIKQKDSGISKKLVVIKTGTHFDTIGMVSKEVSMQVDGNENTASPTANLSTAFIKELPLPIGWAKENRPSDGLGWCIKLAGWLITAFALMLGAPFWFDMLNKVVSVRGAGKRPLKGEEDPRVKSS